MAAPSAGPSGADLVEAHADKIPVQLSLGSTTLVLRDGSWVSDAADLDKQALAGKVTILQDEVRRLRGEESALASRLADSEREHQLVTFRNELLTKMLAVAQLDAEKLARELERERLRTEALKWELMRLSKAQTEAGS